MTNIRTVKGLDLTVYAGGSVYFMNDSSGNLRQLSMTGGSVS